MIWFMLLRTGEGLFASILAEEGRGVRSHCPRQPLHAPIISWLQAGRMFYVEKPCSHNPAEGALAGGGPLNYRKWWADGDSSAPLPTTISNRGTRFHNGALSGPGLISQGRYTISRNSIGTGKEAPVPAILTGILWQGPAPLQAYKDNVRHTTGTGSIRGGRERRHNATHEVIVCRWALGVDFPHRITRRAAIPGSR